MCSSPPSSGADWQTHWACMAGFIWPSRRRNGDHRFAPLQPAARALSNCGSNIPHAMQKRTQTRADKPFPMLRRLQPIKLELLFHLEII